MRIILHILRLFCSIPNMSMKMHSHFLTVHLFQILDSVILNRKYTHLSAFQVQLKSALRYLKIHTLLQEQRITS